MSETERQALAAADEAEQIIASLRNRVVLLNITIRELQDQQQNHENTVNQLLQANEELSSQLRGQSQDEPMFSFDSMEDADVQSITDLDDKGTMIR